MLSGGKIFSEVAPAICDNTRETNKIVELNDNDNEQNKAFTKLLVLRLTGDLQKDVAKLTIRIDNLEKKLNQ